MWIKSQDGETLVNTEYVFVDTRYKRIDKREWIICCKKEDTIIALGEYASKNEAKDVLVSIQAKLLDVDPTPYVFQMPQKEVDYNEE